ncbi:expressed unknown protein [Seminavis robusta]|uniref:Uncharacterized protein n=1 Tax=Seminavis robusta TaxID=568900 RepID=A0A9N8HM32_9STRA|nr:expressed unknown protein [Seminavis robusta]|eukprot:Sro874_g214160.1 n/a (241) ;mRNA; r:8474-9196
MPPSSCHDGLPESPRGVASINLIDEEAASRLNPEKKSVSFWLEDSFPDKAIDLGNGSDGSRLSQVKCFYAPLRAELTEEEKKNLYWTKKNFKSFKRDSKKLANTTDEEKHSVYLTTFMKTYSSPPNDELSIGVVESRDLSCLPLATASVRGLERYIFPGLVEDQNRAKETILRAQTKIVAEQSMDYAQREFILASTSAILSRQSRYLARQIGHADSVVALSIYKNTFLPKKKKADTAETR